MTYKTRLPIFLLFLFLVFSFLPDAFASTWRWDKTFAYYLEDYGTKVRFADDLYCSEIGWFSDRIKFYDASMGGDTKTFWISANANVTVTSLFVGKRATFSLDAPSGTNSTLYLGNLEEPTTVYINDIPQTKNVAWTYTSQTLTVNATHSSTITVDWNPQDRPSHFRQAMIMGESTYILLPSQQVNVTGWLTDLWANVIADVDLQVTYSWLAGESYSKTDERGNFQLSFYTPSKRGTYNIVVDFEGNDRYLACNKTICIIVRENAQTFVVTNIVPQLLLFVAFMLFILFVGAKTTKRR